MNDIHVTEIEPDHRIGSSRRGYDVQGAVDDWVDSNRIVSKYRTNTIRLSEYEDMVTVRYVEYRGTLRSYSRGVSFENAADDFHDRLVRIILRLFY